MALVSFLVSIVLIVMTTMMIEQTKLKAFRKVSLSGDVRMAPSWMNAPGTVVARGEEEEKCGLVIEHFGGPKTGSILSGKMF